MRKILLANTYLLLYNLVESSIRNSIQAIYVGLKNHNIEFDNLKSEIQELIITNLKNHNPSEFLSKISTLAKDIIFHSYNPKKMFEGNIDARKIQELSDKYGFSTRNDARKCKNGEKLLIIKNNRNNLAHGIVSFTECGKDITFNDLKNAFDEGTDYLESIIKNVKEYLDKKQFLKTVVVSK